MLKTKLPSTRLSLHYEFELPGPVVQPSSSAHDAACKKAAALSGLAPPDAVAARAVVKRGLDLKAVHAEPFDAEFHVAKGGPALRYEFYYDPAAPKLIVRIVTSLGEEVFFSLTRPISPTCQSPFFPHLTFQFCFRALEHRRRRQRVSDRAARDGGARGRGEYREHLPQAPAARDGIA